MIEFSPQNIAVLEQIEQEEKKHEEEEIDVVRIDEQITCSQEDSISSIKSIKTAGIIEVQEDTLTIVTHILNDILDAICKRHQLGGSVRLEGEALFLLGIKLILFLNDRCLLACKKIDKSINL